MVIAASPPAVAATPFVPALVAGDALPETALVDQRGRSVRLGGRRDGATIFTFFYTRCPDANECPLESAKFAKLQALLARDGAHLVEITLDPVHDTVPVLARYGAAYGADPARWTLATGTPDAVTALERRAGVGVRAGRGGAFVHDDLAIVLDADGRVADEISGDTWAPQDVVAVTRAIERRPSDPLARLRFALTRGIAAACGGATARGGISAAGGFAVFALSLGGIALAFRRFARV